MYSHRAKEPVAQVEAGSPPRGNATFGFEQLMKPKTSEKLPEKLPENPPVKAVIRVVLTKVIKLDFGLKLFFERYSVPEDHRGLHDLICDPRYVDDEHTVAQLIYWVREAENIFKDNIDALILLAEIKFRLKVSLKFNKLDAKALEKKICLDRCFLSEIEKLLQSNAPVVMPTMKGSNDLEKQFLSRVIGTYKKQYDRTMKHLNRRASAVSTATMTIERVEVHAAPPSFFPRADLSEAEKALINFKASVSSSIGKLSKDKKQEVTKVLCSKKSVHAMCSELRALMSEDADLLQQLNKFEAKHADPKVKIEKPPQPYIEPSAVSLALAKLTIDIEEKDKAIKKLRADRLGLMHSRAEIKEQLLSKVNYLALPEIHKENKKEWVKKTANMRWWDRLRVTFGFKPTADYLSRESAANKCFDLAVAYDQINRGLASESEELIVRGVNCFFSEDFYDQLLQLSESLFKNKNDLEVNKKAIRVCTEECTALLHQQSELDEELHPEPEPVSPTSSALTP